MKQSGKTCAFSDHGSFMLYYEFIPDNYVITIESECLTFNVKIEDNEKASTYLGRIEKYKGKLNRENIYEAVCLLKKALYRNDFDLYIYKDDKVYIKNKQGIKRLKGKALWDWLHSS